MNPIHICIQKISPGNHFSYWTYTGWDVRTGRTGRTDKGTAIWPVIKNGGGIKTHTIYTFYKCWLKQYTLSLAQY